jgi:hypothetical protein
MQEAVEREILEVLAEHGPMPTWKVTHLVKTGRRLIAGNDEIAIYDSWSTSYIRKRLYELTHDRVTWSEAWWGPVRQLIWRLADPPESKGDE